MATEANLLETPPPKPPSASQPSPISLILSGFAEAFRGIRQAAADRSIMSAFLAFLLAIAGFVAFFLAWKGAAATLAVSVQMPYIISGGLAGFALLGLGLGILHTQMSRRIDAREDREWARVLDRALALLDALKRRKA